MFQLKHGLVEKSMGGILLSSLIQPMQTGIYMFTLSFPFPLPLED